MVVDFHGDQHQTYPDKASNASHRGGKSTVRMLSATSGLHTSKDLFCRGCAKTFNKKPFCKRRSSSKKHELFLNFILWSFFWLVTFGKILPTNKLNQLPWCKRFQGVFPVQGTEPNRNHFPNLQLPPPRTTDMMIQDDPWMIPHGSHPEFFFTKQSHTPWAKEPKELPQNSLMTNHPKVRQKTRFVEGDFNPFEKY